MGYRDAGGRDRERGGRRPEGRGERAAAAARNSELQKGRYAKELSASIEQTIRFESPIRPGVTDPRVPEVEVADSDAVSYVLSNGRGRAQLCDLTLLEDASFTQPGGAYARGGWGAEEALCAESFLYEALSAQKAWYAENRRRNINCEIYRNRALAVPKTRFMRDRVHAYADVVACAAPNARRAASEYGLSRERLLKALADRVRFALDVADSLGHEALVVGAWGCGSAGWAAADAAEAFRAELAGGTHGLSKVVFCVPASRRDDLLPRFEHAFAAFPEKNPAPYERPRAEAPKRAAADDGDEEDWRAYL